MPTAAIRNRARARALPYGLIRRKNWLVDRMVMVAELFGLGTLFQVGLVKELAACSVKPVNSAPHEMVRILPIRLVAKVGG